MRYLSCSEKGCGRTFEGAHALAIHKGKTHKTVNGNGSSNGAELKTAEPKLTDEVALIAAILGQFETLPVNAKLYVVTRMEENTFGAKEAT